MTETDASVPDDGAIGVLQVWVGIFSHVDSRHVNGSFPLAQAATRLPEKLSELGLTYRDGRSLNLGAMTFGELVNDLVVK